MRKHSLLSGHVLILLMLFTIIPLSGCGKKNSSMVDKGLTSFCYMFGGGAQGESFEMEIQKNDDATALITQTYKEYHDSLYKQKEYLVDIRVFQDIEDVFRKYHMDSWNNGKFNRLLFEEGEVRCYRFFFEDETVQFSSQLYPERYMKKLDKIQAVISDCIEKGEALASLEKEDISAGEFITRFSYATGDIRLYIDGYARGTLLFFCCNGTAEEISFTDTCSIVNVETGEALELENNEVNIRLASRTYADRRITTGFLPAGKYQLILHGAAVDFELK